MSASHTVPQASAGRTAKLIGLVLLVLGIAVGSIGITETVRKVSGAFVDTFSGPVFATPGDLQLPIHQTGTYLIMQDTSYRNNANTNFPVAAIRPGDAALIGPDGHELNLTPTGGNTRVTRNSADYFDILKFSARVTGDYRLSVFEPSGVRLIVVPSLGESFGRSARWLVARHSRPGPVLPRRGAARRRFLLGTQGEHCETACRRPPRPGIRRLAATGLVSGPRRDPGRRGGGTGTPGGREPVARPGARRGLLAVRERLGRSDSRAAWADGASGADRVRLDRRKWKPCSSRGGWSGRKRIWSG